MLNRNTIQRIVLALVAITGMCIFVMSTVPAHAKSLATQLSIPSIAVDDPNWNTKTTFNSGDQARFVIYVHNPSNFPDYVTLNATVKDGNGYTILGNHPWNVTIPGNSTPGYSWATTIPLDAPYGLFYFIGSAQDSLGSTSSIATFTVVNLKALHAINWAKSQLDSNNWNGYCEVFVENAYGTQYQFSSAQTSYSTLHQSSNWSPYLGSLVWFAPNSSNGGYGHVGIYIGNNQFISATYSGVKINSMVTWSNNIAPYEGWGGAIGVWPGR